MTIVAGIVGLIMVAIAFFLSQAIACFIYANIDLIFGVGISCPNSSAISNLFLHKDFYILQC
ncbi:MAG: hypothetical protein MGF17_04230 [Trichodesmium sp. MAG_R04]|nr:hypothetical protein [Trichodesmium sp. MAG_R04]